MIDLSNVDLVALAGVELRRKGRQLVGACPVCRAGTDRFFIDTRKNAWGCRHCTGGAYRNALHLVAMRDGHNLKSREGFQAACAAIDVTIESGIAHQPEGNQPNAPSLKFDYDADSDVWQDAAECFIDNCHRRLLQEKDKGGRLYEYLVEERALHPSQIVTQQLGHRHKPYHGKWGRADIYLPAGIVIPWEKRNSVYRFYRVRVRTGGNPKYQQAAGAINGLYYTRPITAQSYVVLVEGEFDALSLVAEMMRYQETTGELGVRHVTAVATGGTTQGRVMRHVVELACAKRVLVAFDNDANEAGNKAAQWWLERLPNSVRWAPSEHDVNDMVRADGSRVVDWLREGLQQPWRGT